MERFKYAFLLPILCLFLQGCVHGDLEDCPPMVRYAVAFKYTNHTENRDRFYDDVKKINLYVFDEKNLIYTTTTTTGFPYDDNFNIPLDHLPMGRYTIIAWGNVLDNEPFSITPDSFVTGKTTLSEARLMLQNTADELNNTQLEKLFFGEIKAEIPLYYSRIDTISLTNDTKRIRVAIHWDFSKVDLEDRVKLDSVKVRLDGVNAKYKFDNNIVSTSVTYEPYVVLNSDSIDKNKDWKNIYFYSTAFDKNQKSVYYDFAVLRLLKDIPLSLFVNYETPIEIYNILPESGINIISSSEGFQYLFASEGIASSQWQDTFDKYDYYRIDLYVVQVDKYKNTFVTGGIHINDWIKNPVEGGVSED
jgi:hypothetical protein